MDPAQEFRDRTAIQEIVIRCAAAADDRDLAVIEACFLPGAGYEGELSSGTVEQFLSALARSQEGLRHSTHLIGNQLINVEGDRGTSDATAMVWSRRVQKRGEDEVTVDTTACYRYFDHLVRTDAGWKIARRRAVREWTR